MFKKREHKTIKNKIIDSYKKYLEQGGQEEVVININPRSFCILRQEMWNGLIVNKNGHFIQYEDKRIPILIEKNIPDDIEIIIESRKSFEERELEKIYSRFYSMFESWKWDI